MALPDWAELQWLDQQTPLRLEWSSGLQAAACKAAREGNIAVLRIILTRSGFHCISRKGHQHYCLDATCNDISSCNQLLSTLQFCIEKLRVYTAAVASGQVPVLAWFFREVHPCSWAEICDFDLLFQLPCVAAASGQLPVLSWLQGQVPSKLWKRWLLLSAFTAAARDDRLQVLEWLRNHSDHQDWTAEFSAAAAEFAGVRILRWLCFECSPPCPMDVTAIASAAAAGRLEMMQFLRSLSPPCPMDESATLAAMRGNQPDCLAWLRNQQPKCPWNASALVPAAHDSSLGAIKMARSLDPSIPWDPHVCFAAMSANNAEILAWLLENGAPHPDGDQVANAMGTLIGGAADDAIFLILRYHHVPMPADAIERLQYIESHWSFLMQLLQWARTSQLPQLKLPARKGPIEAGPARIMQQGLLVQLAQLPNELVLRIGAAAGMYYRPGIRILPHRGNLSDQWLLDYLEPVNC